MTNTNLNQLIATEIIENMADYEGTEISELMYEMYNTDYYIIGSYNAKQFLKEYIDELFEVLEYYNDNFGSQYPEITDPEKLASLVMLIKAEELFNSLDTVQDNWDNQVDEEIGSEIIEELKSLV